MATTTTNFGWDIPQSTDLVKDGATAIAALGQDIDTAFVDFKGGTTGQVLKKTSGTDLDVEWGTASSGLTLINTTSFSAVGSVSLPNDTFTSTYTNYRLVVTGTGSNATETNLFFRYRAGGTDNSTSSYVAWSYNRTNTAAGNAYWAPGTSSIIGTCSNQGFSLVADVCQPKAAANSSVISSGQGVGATSNNAIWANSHFLGGTSFDSLTLLPGSGTITGSVSVFGYSV